MRSIVWVVLLVGLPSAVSFGCSGDEESDVGGDGGSGNGGKAGATAGGRAGIGGLGSSGSAGRSGGSSGNASSTGGITGNGGSASTTGGTTANGGSAGAAGGNSDITGGTSSTGGSAGSAGSTLGNGGVAGSTGGFAGGAGTAGGDSKAGGAGSAGAAGGNSMAGNAGSAGAAGSDGSAGNGGVAGAAGGYGTAGTGGIDVSNCQTIKQSATASADGVYSIDPDGAGGNAPFSAYCDMTRDGGGWTLVSKLNSASANGVSEPRGFIGLELNLDQLLDTTMRPDTSPAAHGFARILPLVTDEVTVAKFELVNGSDSTQTLPFYKVVIGANLATWFDQSESTATLTCIDAGLTEQCTTSAFYRLTGGGDESAQILAGMTMSKHGLSAAGDIHLRVDGDYVDFFSGIWSGNSAWRNYDTYWGNGLLVWFRDRMTTGG